MVNGDQYVMITGPMRMLLSSVDNLDSYHFVSILVIYVSYHYLREGESGRGREREEKEREGERYDKGT